MKKILTILSLFLLTNVSLATNPFVMPSYRTLSPEQIWLNNFAEKYELIATIIFLIIFCISIFVIIRNNRILTTQDVELKLKKRIEYKLVVWLLLPFITLFCCEIVKLFILERWGQL